MRSSRTRYYRTIFLGVAALATLVWAAVDQFGLSWQEMYELFLSILSVVGVVILVAALTAAAWIGLRHLASRGDPD